QKRASETKAHATLTSADSEMGALRLVVVLILAAAGFVLAGPKAEGADDAISRLMKNQDDAAKNLPVAPAKPLPAQVAGPTVGSKPQGPLPMVMSARIGEHEDRTRLVIEL